MRIRCRLAVIALCLGVFLLLYFFGGNGADEPPLGEVEQKKDEHFPAPTISAARVAEQSRAEPPGEARVNRKEPGTGSRGDGVSAKLR